ncbi:MAG: zinc finger Ran-binding domain-containing protein [bacterium]
MWQCSSCEYVNDDWDERCLRCGVDRVTSEAELAARVEREARERASQPEEPVQLSALEQRILATPRPEVPAAEEPPAAEEVRASVVNTARKPDSTPPEPVPDKARLQTDVDRLLEQQLASGNAVLPEETRRRGSELTAIIVIAVCLIGLCAVGFVAYSRGMISLPRPAPEQALDFSALGFEGQPAYPKNQDLTDLLADESRSMRPFRMHAQMLYDSQAAYARIMDELTPLPGQTDISAQLDRTSEVSSRLLDDYAEFEQETVPKLLTKAPETVEMLRAQYAARAAEVMGILQQGYIGLEQPEHRAFLLSDSIPELFSRYGAIDASGFSDQWQMIREQRRQLELDEQYAAEIEEAKTWYSTLATLHSEVDKVIRGLGEVSTNRGRLNPAAVKLVVLLDDYAGKIEDLNTQFEDYAKGVPDTDCDSLNEALANFRALALEDHMYCFGEIYKRYSEDRYAELEQYDNLAAHFDYALIWWPRKKPEYEGIISTYEQRWRESWVE